ncbi:glycosyltransferase family 4 protein [bacterium]|nr:glycosyltransferase family 4 protein [bacterium]
MKTLVLSEIFPPKIGGSGRWFYELYSRLPIEEYIIVAGDDENAVEFDAKQDINIIRLNLTMSKWGIKSIQGLKDYIRLFFALRKIIKKEKIDIIHCGRSLPEGLLCLMVWKILKIPYLCYVHGEELATYLHSREFTFLTKLVFKEAKQIIVNSKNTEKFLINYQNTTMNKISIINPGVDTKYFYPAQYDIDIKQKLGWNKRSVILTVGRLQKRKGHDFAILALKKIKEQVPDVLYAIVGNGMEMDYLQTIVSTNKLDKYVQFMKEVDDDVLLDCYQQCDLFLLANRECDDDIEGFGMVLVEAQACGKAVIAGDSGGTYETMIPGETGIVVNCTQPDLIADAVSKLLKNSQKRKKMGEKSVEFVRKNFDWEVHVKKAKQVFLEINRK